MRVAALLLAVALAPFGALAQTGDLVATDALRVCADPANLPFSNARGEGFENRIADLLGRALDRPVEYVFFPQVQGFVRNTLRAGRCDLVMGTVAGDELMQNTNPYYHTSYVIAVRRGAEVPERLDDPAMRPEDPRNAIPRTPPVDLLPRARAGLSAEGIELTDVRMPPGQHPIRLRVSDNEGRETETLLKLDIAK